MSAQNTQSTEELIIKLLKQLERKGKHIQTFLWRLMDEFENEELENEQADEKNDENKVNEINKQISLLHNEAFPNVCKVGHYINTHSYKHLSIESCIICGHQNNSNNKQNQQISNYKQILTFLTEYNTNINKDGPTKIQKRSIKEWIKSGRDKEWALHYAAITGDIKTINELAKHKNINIDQKMTDLVDMIPITCAARYGQLESVIELIKNGANAMPTPDKGNQTPYQAAVFNKHTSIIVFFCLYVKYLYNFEINENTNVECLTCYNYDLNFNKARLNGSMAKYIYCVQCTVENVQKVKKKKETDTIMEQRIIKTLKANPSISVDTLCQMKDVKSLHCIVKELLVSGQAAAYTLWLLDIDNFKAINTHLTHAVADTKIQALGKVLKQLETVTKQQWKQNGYHGILNVWAFRQGGDEFALIVFANPQKRHSLQKLYERLRNDVNDIKLGERVVLDNGKTLEHITVSIGVCGGQAINNVKEMMKKADEAAETVKKGGKNGMVIYMPYTKKFYKDFNEIR